MVEPSQQVVVGAGATRDPARLGAVTGTGLMDTATEKSFDRLAELVQTVLDVPFAFVTVVDDQRSFWKARRGIAEGGLTQISLEESFCQYVVDSGSPLVLPDVRRDPRTRDNPAIRSLGVVAWAGFPVHTPDGHVMGTLCAVDTEVHSWSDRDVRVLASLAEIASREVALRAYATAADTERSRAQLLARIGELLPVGLDSRAIWSALVSLLVPTVADVALVYSVEPDGRLLTRAVQHRDPGRQRELEGAQLLRRGLGRAHGPANVAATGRSEVVRDLTRLSDLSAGQARMLDQFAARSAITVPLTARGRLIAVLSTVRTRDHAPYSSDDLELVEAVADRAALVLDSALSYDEERSLSLQLQQALLPTSLPQPDGLAIAHRYQPAGDVQVVGGDWYDAYSNGPGAARLVIGDVAGHDIHAATVMGQLRTMLRMAGHDGSRPPAATLQAVDDATGSMGQPVFATALLAQVDPSEGADSGRRLTWSSAGHLPPLLLTADGGARLLGTRPEFALGLELAAAGLPVHRADHTAELPAGATLLLYTDGLVERRGEDLDAGLQRLLDTVTEAAAAGCDLEALCDALLDRLGDPADDDIALIAVRVLADGATRPASSVPAAAVQDVPGGLRDDATPRGRMSEQSWERRPPPDTAGRAEAFWEWQISRPAELTAARGRLRDDLTGDALPAGADADDVDRLLLTFEEIASNGLRHGGAPVTVTVTGTADGWLVNVSDARPDEPPTPAVDRDPAFGGLGLHLIARMCTGHGWAVVGRRKHVWACVTPAAG